MSAASPGWYPTPDGRQRYWDGHAWTDHVMTLPHPVTPSAPGYASAGPITPYAAPGGPYAAPGWPGQQVAPRSPALALLASFFIPGLGSMLVERVGTGVMILVCYIVAAMFSVILIGIPFLLGFWVWGMVDAWNGAREWNARRGILS